MIKFILRFFKNFGIYLFVCLPLEIAGLVVIPIALLFGVEHVPKIYTSFHGDEPSSEGFNDNYFGWFYWLAIRNPLNYFQYAVLGYEETGHEFWKLEGVANVGNTDSPGFQLIEGYLSSSTTYLDTATYGYYWIKPYNFFGLRKCIRFRMGHKLSWGGTGSPVKQWVFTFSPFFTYEGN